MTELTVMSIKLVRNAPAGIELIRNAPTKKVMAELTAGIRLCLYCQAHYVRAWLRLAFRRVARILLS